MSHAATAIAPERRQRRWRQILINLSVLLVSTGITLLACEMILRVFLPGYSPLFLDIYRLDEQGLLMLKPDIERRHLTSEWDVTVTTNAEGLRDRKQPVSGENGRVLGIGDSMAFGWGVELAQSFYYVAEEQLRNQRIQIVKAGLPGTGTSDHLRWLQTYGDRYKPKFALLSFYVGNDFTDVQMGGVPGQFTIRDGLMLKKAVDSDAGDSKPGLRDLIEWLKRSSLLAQKAAEGLWQLENRYLSAQQRANPGLAARDAWLWEFAKVHLRTTPPETQRAFQLTVQTLDEMAQWCRQRQIPLLVLVIPRSFQVYDWELTRWKEAYQVNGQDLDLDKPQRVIGEWAANTDVTLLDLLPHFRSHERNHPGDRLYFYPNGHMNANGHRLAGKIIGDAIAAKLASMASPIPLANARGSVSEPRP